MESTNFNKQFHQPWMVNQLRPKEWPNLTSPLNHSMTWNQAWTRDLEPKGRESYGSHVKPVPVHLYRYGSNLGTCVSNEAHTHCFLQHLPSGSSDIRFDNRFHIPYNHFDNIHHKDVAENVTSQWITAGTELIKVATVPISHALLRTPWNIRDNASETVRDYNCEIVEEHSQPLHCSDSVSQIAEGMEDNPVTSDARTEDPSSVEMTPSLELFNNDLSGITSISDANEKEYNSDKVNDCFSQHVTKTKGLKCQPQISEDELCTEKRKFLLIDDQGIPYTVCKDDIISSLQDVDDLDDLSSDVSRRLHYCPVCFRSFLYISDLERHSITHSECKPFQCKVCGKSFKRSSHLQRHKHIHTGARPFLCNICRKGFRESGELQRHQRVHTGEKPYQCEICYVRFTERNTLRRHMKRKHTIQALFRQVAAENSDWEENFMKSLIEDSVL
ncbi:uncharacterized protein [Pyxicephalus adspersus]|uniref:uncharacterized protein isoform X1 n=1 Tax=Pyxicephalus adspersus TaxID=30357 RepID=UPI003B5C3535